MLELELMLSRRQLLLELLAGFFLVTSSNLAMAESGSGSGGSGSGTSGSGSGGSGSSNSGSGNNNDDNQDDDFDQGDDDDQDEARSAVRNGDAAALRDILLEVKKKYSGDVVHVGLKRRSHRLIYMIKLIDPTGKMLLLRVDAKSGAMLREHGS